MSTTKEISIYNPPVIKRALTKTERTILFENLELGSGISHHHFESFGESEDRYLDETRFKSDIPAMLIKNNIEYLAPIIKKRSSKEFNISVQLNVPIRTKDSELQPAGVAASNTQIYMIGVIFSNTENHINSTRLPTISETSTLKDRISSGIYGLYSWYYQPYHDTQLKYSMFFQDQTYLKVKDKRFIVYFKNMDDSKRALILINKYVNHMIDYYNDSMLYMHSALEHAPLAKLTKNVSRSIVSTRKEKHVFKSPLISMLNSIYTNNLTIKPNRTILLYDLVDGKLWSVYQSAKMMGLDSEVVKKLVGVEKERQRTNKIIHDTINDSIYQKYIYYKKLHIARSLFHKNNFSDLTSKEINVVDLTYKKDMEFAAYTRKNKCVHLKLLERVMQSNNSWRYFDNRAWADLKKLVPYDNTSEFLEDPGLLKCTLCDFLVLCPHHYDQFEHKTSISNIDNRGESDKELRLLLLRKYTDKTPIEDTYYCKICGEKIIKKYNEEHESFIQGEKVHVTHNVDTMGNKIWKEVRNIIGTNIIFNTVTDVNVLTTNITDTIQPYIEDEQTRLQNIKTNAFDVVQNTVYLYISLYAYASLIRIMSHYPEDIQFKKGFTGFTVKKKVSTVTGGKNVRGTNKQKAVVNTRMLQGLLKTGLGLFVTTKLSLIKKIPNISMDSIKPLFIKAFRTITKLYIKSAEFNTESSPEYVANSVVYNYLYYVNSKDNIELKFSDVRKILGVELQDTPALENIMDKAVIPKIWELQPPDEDLGYYNDPVYLKEYHEYSYSSFIHFIKYIKEGLFNVSVYDSVKLENHAIEYKELKKMEDIFSRAQEERCTFNIFVYHNKQYGIYTYKPVDLSKIFCPDGRKHKFDIHIYEHGMSRYSISKNNIDEYMFNKDKNIEFREMKKIDVQCTICGTFLSKTKDIPGENSIINVLNRNDEIAGFYNMYMFKCPVKDVHKYVDDVCTNCGVTKLMIFKKDVEYYKKYINEFYSELKKQLFKDRTILHIDTEKQNTPVLDKYIPWVVDYTPIVELSKIANVSINILYNIGLFEGNNYEKIISGEHNPSKTRSDDPDCDQYINQIIYIESYMNAFLIDYEVLKNGRSTQPSIETFTKKWENADFSKFPDVASKYHTLRRYHTLNGIGTEKMINFVLHSLTNALVIIYKHSISSADILREINLDATKDFIKYTIDKIITSEKYVSDPGILRGKLLDIDDDIDGDAVDAIYDDIIYTKGDEDYDPFSLESTGIDSAELYDNMGTGDD
jgi:hypothetical protein